MRSVARHRGNRRRAGTSVGIALVEVLVVLGVLGLLAALLLPSLVHPPRRATIMTCMNQLRQLSLAMAQYAADSDGWLPMAHAEAAWTGTNPPPWTRPLLPYYRTTNVLRCPSYSLLYRRSPFSYFMGARSAFVEAGAQPASVHLDSVRFPTQYVLSGDCNLAFAPQDADPDNYTFDTLFGNPLPRPPQGHLGNVNVLFADQHVVYAKRFDRSNMTFSHLTLQVDWDDWDLGLPP